MPTDGYNQAEVTYDPVYTAMKDYAREAARLRGILARFNAMGGRLLDVACGTGLHLEQLRHDFEVSGLDISPSMLDVARKRLPGVELIEGSMADFNLGIRFDVVTCLFSAIGHMPNVAALNAAITCMAIHVEPGGTLIVEPWITPEQWDPRKATGANIGITDDGRTVYRVTQSTLNPANRRVHLDMNHFVVGGRDGIEHIAVEHYVTCFTDAEYRGAFRAAGLELSYDPEGLMGRGLYIGHKPR